MDTFEIVLRGAAAGISFLLAFVLAGSGGRTRIFGALFSFSVGIYVLLGSDVTKLLYGVFTVPAALVAILGTVFFWWFAAALFDDGFRWRWWRFAPAVILPGLYLARLAIGESPVSMALSYLHLGANAALFADAIRLAIQHLGDDLVIPRRRFRVTIAAIVGLFGVGIAGAEIIGSNYVLPGLALRLHALGIFALNFVFAAWVMRPREALFAENPAAADEKRRIPAPPTVSAADRPIFEKLDALMNDGVYREEGLTVARLAEKVGIPEHHLRKLINGALGYRNFSAFLNSRRIEDAKATLADPANARKQVLQIALDLGFGSIAPFNRAFKEAAGVTPSAFRKNALAEV